MGFFKSLTCGGKKNKKVEAIAANDVSASNASSPHRGRSGQELRSKSPHRGNDNDDNEDNHDEQSDDQSKQQQQYTNSGEGSSKPSRRSTYSASQRDLKQTTTTARTIGHREGRSEVPPPAREAAFSGPPRFDWIDIVSIFVFQKESEQPEIEYLSVAAGWHKQAAT